MAPEAFALPLVAALLLLVCWHDLATRLLPDGIALGILALALLVRLASGDLVAAFVGAGAVVILAILPWRLGALGGGDVKLLGVCALLAGPDGIPTFLAATTLSGGLLSVAYLAGRHWPPRIPDTAGTRLGRVIRAEARRMRRGGPLPYALAISAGALITLANGA